MLIYQRVIVYSPQLASGDFSHMENHHVFSKRRAFIIEANGPSVAIRSPVFRGKKTTSSNPQVQGLQHGYEGGTSALNKLVESIAKRVEVANSGF